jgi:hypothetical protein
MIRTRGLWCLLMGAVALAAWYFSGSIGHFLELKDFDPHRYPYDMSRFPYVRAHWPLQLLLLIGGPLFLVGFSLFIFDLSRNRRNTPNVRIS